MNMRRAVSASTVSFFLLFSVKGYGQQAPTDGHKVIKTEKKQQAAISNQTEILQQIQELQKGQDDIRMQLEEIVKLLRQQATSGANTPDVKGLIFDLGNHPIKGSEAAKLTLIEITDYQCPYCARYFRETYPQIEQTYVETGKLRYVKFDTPLEGVHKSAFQAALATHCASEQGKYWEMDQRLVENQNSLERFRAHAEALGLNLQAFEECVATQRYAPSIPRTPQRQ